MPLTLAMTAPLLIVTHKVSNHHLRHEWQLSKLIEKYGNFCGTKTLCYEFFFGHNFAHGRNRIGEVGTGCAIRLL
jgi:hypothetical protein